MRKGYYGEYFIKKYLEKDGDTVLKLPIWQIFDFLVIEKNSNRIKKVIEVKETHNDKFYPSKREKEQFDKIKEWSKKHNVPAYLFIRFIKNKKSKIVIKKLN